MMGGAMLLTVATNLSAHLPNPVVDLVPGLSALQHQQHPSMTVVGLMALASVLPILVAVWVAGRYLMLEPDEFIRSLVTRSLLWGFAGTMAGMAIMNVWMNLYPQPFPLTILSADLFFITSAVAFRLMQRSYR